MPSFHCGGLHGREACLPCATFQLGASRFGQTALKLHPSALRSPCPRHHLPRDTVCRTFVATSPIRRLSDKAPFERCSARISAPRASPWAQQLCIGSSNSSYSALQQLRYRHGNTGDVNNNTTHGGKGRKGKETGRRSYPPTMSDIRVFVTFPGSNAVFAGETLECKITFKNTAQKPSTRGPPSSSQLSSPTSNGYAVGGPRVPLAPPLHTRSERTSPRPASARPPSANPKPTTQHTVSTAKSPVLPSQPQSTPNVRANQNHKHQRSISIVSLSSDMGSECGGRGPGTRDGVLRSPPPQQRPRGHGRSASLQITTGRQSSVTNGSIPPSGTVLVRCFFSAAGLS